MTRKRQINSNEPSSTDHASKKSAKPMTFDEVAAIIRSGDSEKLKHVIEAGRVSNINRLDRSSGTSLLLIACESGFIEFARVLLAHNADINFSTNSGSVLKGACMSGNADLVRFIIDQGVTVNDTIILGLFAYDEIIANIEIATILVGCIQDVDWEVTREDGVYSSFLHKTCGTGNVTIARLLLERGASLCYEHSIPFIKAAHKGHLEVVKLLLCWMNKSNERMSQESIGYAFMYAAGSGHMDIVRYLLEYVTDAGFLHDALCEAVSHRHIEIATIVLDACTSFKDYPPSYACSTWIHACQFGSADMMRLFLDRGADPNAVDDKGKSPLRTSLWRTDKLKLLLERGAYPNQHFPDGSTALLLLLQCETRICRQLLRYLNMGPTPT